MRAPLLGFMSGLLLSFLYVLLLALFLFVFFTLLEKGTKKTLICSCIFIVDSYCLQQGSCARAAGENFSYCRPEIDFSH
jgi:hypothetical protein